MPSTDRVLWKTVSSEYLHYRLWENESIVYDSRTGDTHLLDIAAVNIMQEMGAAPHNYQDLLKLIARMTDLEACDQPEGYLTQLLTDLLSLDLIERIECD